jgi:hypothetical protein
MNPEPESSPEPESPFDRLRRAVERQAEKRDAVVWAARVVQEADDALLRGDYRQCADLLDRLDALSVDMNGWPPVRPGARLR